MSSFILLIMLSIGDQPKIVSEPPNQTMFIGDEFFYQVEAENCVKLYLNAHNDLELTRKNAIQGTLNHRGVYVIRIVARNENLFDVQQFYIKVRYRKIKKG